MKTTTNLETWATESARQLALASRYGLEAADALVEAVSLGFDRDEAIRALCGACAEQTSLTVDDIMEVQS